MKRVLKFAVPADDAAHEIDFPASGVVLIGVQGSVNVVYLWGIQGERPTTKRRFRVFGTGQPIPDDARYVGSTQAGTLLVWHVFEVPHD